VSSPAGVPHADDSCEGAECSSAERVHVSGGVLGIADSDLAGQFRDLHAGASLVGAVAALAPLRGWGAAHRSSSTVLIKARESSSRSAWPRIKSHVRAFCEIEQVLELSSMALHAADGPPQQHFVQEKEDLRGDLLGRGRSFVVRVLRSSVRRRFRGR
jgi:hypothetical protein